MDRIFTAIIPKLGKCRQKGWEPWLHRASLGQVVQSRLILGGAWEGPGIPALVRQPFPHPRLLLSGEPQGLLSAAVDTVTEVPSRWLLEQARERRNSPFDFFFFFLKACLFQLQVGAAVWN